MRRFVDILLLSALVLTAPCASCEDPVTPDPPTPSGPTEIKLSQTSFSVDKAGATLSLEVTAPNRPSVSGMPSWISFVDGTFSNYKVTYGFKVDANTSYEQRSATVYVSCVGATAQSFTVTQEAAENPSPTPTPSLDPVPTPGDNVAWKMAATLGLGWNLGNQMDGYYNGPWAGEKEGYPEECVWQPDNSSIATQATFDGAKAAGITSVRIPVSWLKMIGPAPEYKIDEAWMARVKEIVGYAHNVGMNVIINTHHDENHGTDNTYQWQDIKKAVDDPELNEAIKAKIKGVWTNIATAFADCGDWLIMEGFNEINDGGWGWSEDFRKDPTRQCNILNDWNQVFVDAVRATGGNNAARWLSVPTYAANPQFVDYLKLPDDPSGRLMVSVHFYDPSDYTILEKQYSDWGHTGDANKKASGGDEDHVQQVFGKLFTELVDKGIPCYVGEFGASVRSKSDSRAWLFYLYYMEFIVKAAKSYGLPCFIWDNGAIGAGREKHGYIHHGTGAFMGDAGDVVAVMNKAWWTESEDYTLQTVFDSAPKSN